MNVRKLKRAQNKKSTPSTKAKTAPGISATAARFARYGTTGSPRIDCLGHFIFFSTRTGEAWMLDHRDNRALRLTDGFKKQEIHIIEDDKRFAIKWPERYEIQDEYFITTQDEEQRIYKNYPIKELRTLIEMLEKKNNDLSRG